MSLFKKMAGVLFDFIFFFFNDTATTEIYTLSLHDALPIAALTKRPDRFVGMHFMNPVPVMVLVEVIRALQTSDTTFETTMKLAEKLEKKPVAVKDGPGFVLNRVLMRLINWAAYGAMEAVA